MEWCGVEWLISGRACFSSGGWWIVFIYISGWVTLTSEEEALLEEE